MKRALRWLAILMAIGIAFAGGMWFYKQVQIDKRLDRGGAWQYESSACQGAKLDQWQRSGSRSSLASCPPKSSFPCPQA